MGPVPCDNGAQGMALSHWRLSPPIPPALKSVAQMGGNRPSSEDCWRGRGGVSAKETFTKFLAPREHSIQGWLPFPFLEARRRGGEGASVRDLFRHTAVIHLGFGRGDSVPRSCPAVCTSTLLPDCSPTGTGVSLPEQSNGIWGLVVESHIPVGYSSFS